MSRSYKKFPACSDKGRHGSHKENRTIANRKVRRRMNQLAAQSYFYDDEDMEDIFIATTPRSKNIHKKMYESYDICDYKFICTRLAMRKKWESDKKTAINGGLYGAWLKENNESFKEREKWWAKYYYRK